VRSLPVTVSFRQPSPMAGDTNTRDTELAERAASTF